MADTSVRLNMYDRINTNKLDVAKEYARIWKLFNTADYVGPRVTPLIAEVSACIQFFPDSFKKRAMNLEDFNDIYGFNFSHPNEKITADDLILYCEFVITLCDHLWKYSSDLLEYDAGYLREYLYSAIESCMDDMGLILFVK